MAPNSLTPRPARRTYSPQFKAEMVAQCLEGSVALASLAIDHGMNPNVLHRWVTEHERYVAPRAVVLKLAATDSKTINACLRHVYRCIPTGTELSPSVYILKTNDIVLA